MAELTSDDLLAAYRVAIIEEQRAWEAYQAAEQAYKAAKEQHAKANQKFRELEHDFLTRVRQDVGLAEFDPLRLNSFSKYR